jgi:hypothetical protein
MMFRIFMLRFFFIRSPQRCLMFLMVGEIVVSRRFVPGPSRSPMTGTCGLDPPVARDEPRRRAFSFFLGTTAHEPGERFLSLAITALEGSCNKAVGPQTATIGQYYLSFPWRSGYNSRLPGMASSRQFPGRCRPGGLRSQGGRRRCECGAPRAPLPAEHGCGGRR